MCIRDSTGGSQKPAAVAGPDTVATRQPSRTRSNGGIDLSRFEISLGGTIDSCEVTMMAIPVRWDERKDLPGFGDRGTFYPSVRLWSKDGAILTTEANNGTGARVYVVETDEAGAHDGSIDMEAVRLAWRNFAANPVSYNWRMDVAELEAVRDKAKNGPEGSVAKMMTARTPRNRWILEEEEAETEGREDEGKGEDRYLVKT